MKITVDDITIRNRLGPGDLGKIIQLHGLLYSQEYHYGVQFEKYVAEGLLEFLNNYDDAYDRVWLCDHNNELIGSLVLMHRDNNAAQLRYFLITPQFRGIGLGKFLIHSFYDCLHEKKYQTSYLWTTEELHTAIALYKRMGYQLTKELATDHFGKYVTEQRYDLILK